MKILITGGAGYLGSVCAARLLQEGHSVRVLDSLCFGGGPLLGLTAYSAFEFQRSDVRDLEAVRRAVTKVNAVVHLAAVVGDPACTSNPVQAREVNDEGALQVWRASAEAGVQRFVFASTCSLYGRAPDTGMLLNESSPLNPQSLYAQTKADVEAQLLAAHPEALAVTVLRFASMYGLSPRMRFDLTLNEYVMRLKADRELVISGEQLWRPYVHVRDAARAIHLTLRAPSAEIAGEVFNVGDSDENYRRADLLRIAQEYAPDGHVRSIRALESDCDHKVSFAKIQNALNFVVSMRVPDGVRELADALDSGLLDQLKAAEKYNAATA